MLDNIVNWLIDNWRTLLCIVFAVTLIFFVVLFIVASIPTLTDGIVIDKDYDPPRTDVHTSYIDGKPQVRTYHYGAKYSIKVQGVNEEGETITEWWSLGEGLYSIISIGDRVHRENGAISVK